MVGDDVRSLKIIAGTFSVRDSSPRLLRKSPYAPDDARFIEVVLRHLHLHAVADGQLHEFLAHLAGDGRQHLMLVVQLDTEHRAGQHRHNFPFNFNMFFHAMKAGV